MLLNFRNAMVVSLLVSQSLFQSAAALPGSETVQEGVPAQDQREFCAESIAVPFTSVGDAGALRLTAGRNFCLDTENLDSPFGPAVPLASIEASDGREVVFVREPVNSFFGVFYRDQEADWRRIDLDFTQRSKLHFEHAFVHLDRFFFLAYNVELSVPSGRRLSGLTEGIGLFEVSVTGDQIKVVQVPDANWSAGLEAAVFHVNLDSRTIICAALDCQELRTVRAALQLRPVTLNLPSGSAHRIAELSGSGDAVFAMIQREYDDRVHGWPKPNEPVFYTCELLSANECTPHLSGGTPWNLQVNDGTALYKVARTKQEYADLLAFDLHRLRQTGVATFMENNLEGRIAWSSVYYLNGLISLAADEPGLGTPFNNLAGEAKRRVAIELSYWCDALDQQYPGFQSKRYALDREPLLSALHIGRIVRVIMRAENLLQTGPASNRFSELLELIRPGTETLEYISRKDPGRTELRIHRYAPFWADGTNAPWNYQSGWIDGVVALDDTETGKLYSPILADMLSQFILDEDLLSLPDVWNYTGGDTFSGWTLDQQISSNTPAWSGDKTNTQTAHISYRTMDVMALLSADRAGYYLLPARLKEHLFSLVDRGRVWPFAMEEAHRHGHRLTMDPSSAQLFARSVHPYDLQSQVWVIPILAEREFPE
jgi:hypothetical protein